LSTSFDSGTQTQFIPPLYIFGGLDTINSNFTIQSSTDFVNWKASVNSPFPTNAGNWTANYGAMASAYGIPQANLPNGQGFFVCGGSIATAVGIAYSSDGSNWNNRTGAQIGNLAGFIFSAIEYANGVWVASGLLDSALVYSTDASNWTICTRTGNAPRSSDGYISLLYGSFTNSWLTIHQNNTRAATTNVFRSVNGSNWSNIGPTTATLNTIACPAAIAYADGLENAPNYASLINYRWIITDYNTNTLFYSSDSITWAKNTVTIQGGLTFGQSSGEFALVNNIPTWMVPAYRVASGTSIAYMLYSSDCTNWSSITIGTVNSFTLIADVLYIPLTSNWNIIHVGTGVNTDTSFTYYMGHSNLYKATTPSFTRTTPPLVTNTTGYGYSKFSRRYRNIQSIEVTTVVTQLLIAGGPHAIASSTIQYSTDGFTWYPSAGPAYFATASGDTSAGGYMAAYGIPQANLPNGSGLFVCTGASNAANTAQLLWSSNGSNWNLPNNAFSLPAAKGGAIEYGNGRWIAATIDTNISQPVYSTDGSNWNSCTGANTVNRGGIRSIVFGNNIWMLNYVNAGTTSYKSTDGVNFAPITTNIPQAGTIVYADGIESFPSLTNYRWIIPNYNTQTLYYSSDSTTWASFTATVESSYRFSQNVGHFAIVNTTPVWMVPGYNALCVLYSSNCVNWYIANLSGGGGYIPSYINGMAYVATSNSSNWIASYLTGGSAVNTNFEYIPHSALTFTATAPSITPISPGLFPPTSYMNASLSRRYRNAFVGSRVLRTGFISTGTIQASTITSLSFTTSNLITSTLYSVSSITSSTTPNSISIFTSSINGQIYTQPQVSSFSNFTVSSILVTNTLSTNQLFLSSINNRAFIFTPTSNRISTLVVSTLQVSSFISSLWTSTSQLTVTNTASVFFSTILSGNIFISTSRTLNVNAASIAIGSNSGSGASTITVGAFAGQSNQQTNSIAFGIGSGQVRQNPSSIAIGYQAGFSNQSTNSIAIGNQAGFNNQGQNAIAIGNQAGFSNQSTNSIAIGNLAGYNLLSFHTIAIGASAQYSNVIPSDESYGISIGAFAGNSNQVSTSIFLNATGVTNIPISNKSWYVTPLRSNVTGFKLKYDPDTNEITYSSVV
jgi:hypothetical protein